MSDYETTNLLLASLLMAGNASLSDLEIGSRFSKVKVDISSLDTSVLAAKLRKLADELEQAGDPQIPNTNSPQADYGRIYDRSILGDIEDKYLRLKRMIFQGRK
jgi:outer membrane murein-binding lipoprotein Lpp